MSRQPLLPEESDVVNVNFRDVGDVDAKVLLPKRLYRCSMIFDEKTVGAHGIKTLVDLRRESAPPVVGTVNTADGEAAITRHHVSLVSNGVAFALLRSLHWSKKLQLFCCFRFADSIIASQITKSPRKMAVFYSMILDNAQEEIKSVMEHFVNPDNYPVLVHCIAGKDRTGIIIAILLMLCEVDNDKIVEDYAKSQTNLQKAADEGLLGDQTLFEAQHIMSPAAAMREMLESFEEIYGSAHDYLEEIGLTEDQVDQIRENLMINPF